MLMGVAAVAQVRAEEFGVARVSDRPQAVVRAQSQELAPAPAAELEPVPTVELTDCETPNGYYTSGGSYGGDGSGSGSHGYVSGSGSNGYVSGGTYTTTEGMTPGLHHSVSCPEHGGVFDGDCPRCRYFAGFGQGGWTLDAHGNPVWTGPTGESIGDRMAKGFHNFGEKFCKGLSRLDKCFDKNGKGTGQPLVGHYKMVYPVDPWYFDGRDGQAYAAEGYGGPVSVPLAPVVRQQYNYGWGIPSSRITPISRPLPLGVEHP
jgi:hypothetical protein